MATLSFGDMTRFKTVVSGRDFQIAFQDATLLLSSASFDTMFLKIVVLDHAFGPPHVLRFVVYGKQGHCSYK